MDVSGSVDVLLREFESSKGLLYENHVYGCVSLLEQWIEGSLDLSGTRITFRDETSPFDLEAQWDQVGAHHGFYRPLVAEAPYEGSPEYRALWKSLFTGPALSVQLLDDFEEALWKAYKDAKAVYFCGALATGELTPELLEQGLATVVTAAVAATAVTAVTAVTAAVAAPVVPAVPTNTPTAALKRRRKTRDNRIITPIKTHRKFAFTRRGKTA